MANEEKVTIVYMSPALHRQIKSYRKGTCVTCIFGTVITTSRSGLSKVIAENPVPNRRQ